MDKKEPIRLQKFLAQCGIASRRKAEELILQGKVKVNGKPAILGDKVTDKDKVFVSGKRIVMPRTKYRYIMLNKPRGFVTTMSDEKGRKCVAELVADVGERRECSFSQTTANLPTRSCIRATACINSTA